MHPIDELMAEHQGILTALKIVEAMAQGLEAGRPPARDDLTGMLEFIRVFADQCHHGKEEAHLFPALEAAGIPRAGGPIGVMLAEHEQGRALVRQMGRAVEGLAQGRAEAAGEYADAARGYAALLRGHIHKEDNVLFVMARARLSPATMEELERAFARVEEERVGAGRHEAFHALLDELGRRHLG